MTTNNLLKIYSYEEFKFYMLGLFEGKGENEKMCIFNAISLLTSEHKWICDKWEVEEIAKANFDKLTQEEKSDFIEQINSILNTDFKNIDEAIEGLKNKGGYYEIAHIFLNHFETIDDTLNDDVLERLFESLEDWQIQEKAKNEIKEKFLKNNVKVSFWKKEQIYDLILTINDYFENSKNHNYIIKFANDILNEI